MLKCTNMSANIVYLIFCVFFFVQLVSTAVINREDYYRLDLIHYNDFHDRFEETSADYPICTKNDTSCLGGFARLYYEINALLKEKPDAIVLDAGDTFQGTYWYSMMKWRVIEHFINMLPNDAHTIGNHEFDNGVDSLEPYLRALRAPVLVANIDTRLEPSLNGLYLPRIVLKRKGRKIGIIGVTTVATKTSSKPGQVLFLDPVKSASEQANILKQEGVDIILLLSHCGLDVDIQIAKEVGEHIDVIIGGHTHSLLWNGESPSKENVSGPYPIEVPSQSNPNHKVLVVTASAYTKYLGNIATYFDAAGDLVAYDGQPVFLNRSIPEDSTMKRILQPFVDKMHKLVGEVVGYTEDNLIIDSCPSGGCAIGSLTADAFLNASLEAVPSNLPAVAFLNSNMIRGSISKGNVTRGAVINSSPFSNKVITFILPGRNLIEAMEACLQVSYREVPFAGPKMPQIAGMKLTLNTTSKKVVSLTVKDGEGYVDLDPDHDYQVTTPDFIVIGGNGLANIQKYSRNIQVIGTDYTTIETYIRKISPIGNYLDNRLTIVT